jgi:hypothetical protein
MDAMYLYCVRYLDKGLSQDQHVRTIEERTVRPVT